VALAAVLVQDQPPQFEEAIRVCGAALEIDPKNTTVHRFFGWLFLQVGRLEEAETVFRRAIALEPTNPDGYQRLGRAHIAKRDWGKAADNYRRAVELASPGDGELWFECAAVQLLAGDRAGYRRSCVRLLELGTARIPNVRSYHVARAWTLAPLADEKDSAKVSALAARELKQSAAEFWSLTEGGALLCRAGRPKEAVPLLERSLAANEKPGAAVLNWLWLAFTYHQLGQADKAREWLARADAWLDKLGGEKPPLPRADELGLHDHNWLEAQVLRRELDALLR
jgi:eukaryotic-like serine/threonine-protein kinase